MVDATSILQNLCQTTRDISLGGAFCGLAILFISLVLAGALNVLGEDQPSKKLKDFVIGERGFIVLVMVVLLAVAYVYAPQIANMIAPGEPC